MTPPAITPAGRGARTKAPNGRGSTAKARTAGHRNRLHRETAPSAPRRVSGPLSGLGRGRAVPGSPRRNAGRPRQAPAGRGLVASAVAFVRALPDHAVLDRLIRGRVWIPLLGVLLAGIVAMQVEVLKLGTSMGRSLERTTALQSRNELLQASVATLADDQRIERLAAGMGMVMPDPDAVNFLAAEPVGNVKQIVASIHEPDASAFTAHLPVSGTPAGTATPGAIPVDATAAPATSIAAPDSSTSATSTGVSDTGSTAAVQPTSSSAVATSGQAQSAAPTQTAAPTAAVTPTQTAQNSTDQAASSSGGAAAPTGG